MGFHIDYPCGLAMWVCFCFNTVILIKYMNAGKKKRGNYSLAFVLLPQVVQETVCGYLHVCVLVCLYALRIVSMDKILCCTNPLFIIIVHLWWSLLPCINLHAR